MRNTEYLVYRELFYFRFSFYIIHNMTTNLRKYNNIHYTGRKNQWNKTIFSRHCVDVRDYSIGVSCNSFRVRVGYVGHFCQDEKKFRRVVTAGSFCTLTPCKLIKFNYIIHFNFFWNYNSLFEEISPLCACGKASHCTKHRAFGNPCRV